MACPLKLGECKRNLVEVNATIEDLRRELKEWARLRGLIKDVESNLMKKAPVVRKLPGKREFQMVEVPEELMKLRERGALPEWARTPSAAYRRNRGKQTKKRRR